MAFVLRNSGSSDDADDLLQEALVILWERVRSGRFEHTARLDTFVFATAKNLWLRRLAQKRREAPAPLDPDLFPTAGPSSLDDLVDSERAAAVHAALDRLGDPCRELLLLFYWEEFSMEEIALRLGFANADTAKAKKYQCKKALQGLLKGVADHD